MHMVMEDVVDIFVKLMIEVHPTSLYTPIPIQEAVYISTDNMYSMHQPVHMRAGYRRDSLQLTMHPSYNISG